MKFWKKASAIGLATAVVFTSVSPVLAEDTPTTVEEKAKEEVKANVQKDKAVELAKKYVKISDDYTLRNVHYNSNYYVTGGGVWELYFEKNDTDNRVNASIHVSIDAQKGTLLGFNKYDQSNQATYPPKVELQEAKEIAASYLEEMHADIIKNLKYNENFEKNYKTPLKGDVRYHFQYDRVENGVTFPLHNVSVTVDGNGNVVGYYFHWNDKITFESVDNMVSVEEATKKLQTETDLLLSYKLPWGKEMEKEPKPFIAYQIASGILGLDAKTGEFIQYNGKAYTSQGELKTLTEKPLANMPTGNKNFTQEDAVKVITSTFELPANAVLENAYFEENHYGNPWGKRSMWSLHWRVPGESGKEGQFFWANVDSKTGEILGFNKDRYYYPAESDGKAPAIAPEKAKELALDWVKKLVPYYTDQLILDTSYLDNLSEKELSKFQEYGFNFQRVVNGIRTEMDNIYITIDADTGKLIRYHNNFRGIQYPSQLPEIISLEQAREIYMKQYDIELRYHVVEDYELYNSNPAKQSEPKIAQLIYQLVPKNMYEPVFLDAESGKWINQETGEVTTFEKPVATDIKGHWAEKPLQLMIDYKAIDVKDGKVLPNQKITRGEMIKMLIISMNGGYYRPYYGMERKATFMDVSNQSEYFAYVETAVDRKLIDKGEKFNPDAPINRDEMAELIVRALGYHELAKHNHIFALNVKDAKDIKNKGHVAIVMGLEIMSASKELFNPDREVSRAEAAVAFYRYLEKRAGRRQDRRGLRLLKLQEE